MKNFGILLHVFLAITFSSLNAQSLEWAHTIGGSSTDYGWAISLDNSENVVVSGFLKNTADFDPDTGTFNLSSNGSGDIFIAKYDANQKLIWAFNVGASGNEIVYDLAIDKADNIYITGTFDKTMDFDPSAGEALVSTQGSNDIFVAKYDMEGNYKWAFGIGTGNSFESGESIKVDHEGNIIIGGYISAVTSDFDPSTAVFNVTNNGGTDIFAAKYDSSGNFIWVKTMGNEVNNRCHEIAIDKMNNIYLTGYIQDTVDMDPGSGVDLRWGNGTSGEVFLTKLDKDGNYEWTNMLESASLDKGFGVVTDMDDNVFVTGYFSGTLNADPLGVAPNLVSNGQDDVYLIKFRSEGAYDWGVSFGGANDDEGLNLTTDLWGNIYLTGYYKMTVDLDPGVDTSNFTSSGNEDVFISKFNNQGEFRWGFGMGASSNDQGMDVVVNSSGNIYLTGMITNSFIDFDPGQDTLLLTPNSSDCFLAKYTQCLNFENREISICEGDSILVGNSYRKGSGVYHEVYSIANKCDSIISTTLQVNSPSYSLDLIVVCDTFMWNNKPYSVSGNYVDTIPNTQGCDSIMTLNLTINPKPVVSLNLVVDTLCTTSSPLLLEGGTPNGGTYTGISIMNNIFDPSTVGQGVYFLEYVFYDSAGCFNSASAPMVVEICTDLVENNDNFVFVFPNPNQGIFRVGNYSQSFSSFRIFNVMGALVFESNVEPRWIDISTEKAGIYFYELLTQEGSIYRGKILKEN